MNKLCYTIEVRQVDNTINGDWSEPTFQAILKDKSGDGIVTTGGSERGVAVRAIARYESMLAADKLKKEGGELVIEKQPEEVTETHESSLAFTSAGIRRRQTAAARDSIERLLSAYAGVDKPVSILYKGASDDYAKWRTIDVKSIERSGLGWEKTVFAYCHKARGQRSFRLDRIERAEVMG